MSSVPTPATRLRWHPARKEWQASTRQHDGTDGPWFPLNAEWDWHEDERRQAQADARDAFGWPTRVVDFAATSAEHEHCCYTEKI